MVLQERNSNNIPRVTYTRGLDMGGRASSRASFDGAGGVGGLLAMTTHAQTSNYTHYFYHSDGMGNITALQDTNQVVQAKYAYDPWGNLFSMAGPLTNLNRMRVSGKEWHPQSGLIDFGARFYNPTWQRWITEDPIGIAGGLNLYAYVGNSPFNHIDPWGLIYDEEADLDARLEIAATGSALFADLAYDPDTYARHEEIMAEGVLTVIEFFEGVAEDLAWKAACPVMGGLKIVRDPLKKAAKKGAEELVEGIGKVAKKKDSLIGPGKPFTQAQKRQILEENRARNKGILRSDASGKRLVQPAQHTKGVSPPSNEAHVDHIIPRSKGGANSRRNSQVLSRKENLSKSNK